MYLLLRIRHISAEQTAKITKSIGNWHLHIYSLKLCMLLRFLVKYQVSSIALTPFRPDNAIVVLSLA